MTDPGVWTDTERVELESAVRASDCTCATVVRTHNDRAGINAARVDTCSMHAQLAHDPRFAPRLLAYRRYRERLLAAEFTPADYLREDHDHHGND